MATEKYSDPCTVQALEYVITGENGIVMMPSRGVDEVYPNILIGDK